MHKPKFFLVGILIVAILATMGFTGCTGGAPLTPLQGVVKSIDTLSGTVVVTLKDNSTRSFNLADVKAGTIVTALGGPSIEVGDEVNINEDQNGNVQEIEGNFAEVDGNITDLGINSISITTEDQGGNITLGVTPETIICIEDGGGLNLTDLQAGQQVEVRYDVSSLQALRITVQNTQAGNETEGTITAIDVNNHMVTVTTENMQDIVFQVTSDTIIYFREKGTAAFNDLQLGLMVQVKYDPISMDALKIKVNDYNNYHD